MPNTLDRNERAFLLCLQEVDPGAEYWTTHWATGMDLLKHGADRVGASYEGSYSVMKELKKRGLVDAEGRLSHTTGVAINAKGLKALG